MGKLTLESKLCQIAGKIHYDIIYNKFETILYITYSKFYVVKIRYF